MRRSKAIQATAWGVVAAGTLAPLVRKRLPLPPLLTQAVAFAAPVGLCVATRRSRARDIATCSLQMWAYLAAYKSPHDDPEHQERRVRIDYPIAIDRALGLGELPTVRLQRALASVGPDGPRWRALDRVLVWAHWSWFLVPHGGLLYILLCHRQRFDRAAVLTYAVFDIGAMIYWVLPTAPPWYAAAAPEGGGPGNGGSAHDAPADPEGAAIATAIASPPRACAHVEAEGAAEECLTVESPPRARVRTHEDEGSGDQGDGDRLTVETPPRVSARGRDARGGVFEAEVTPRRALAVRRMMVEFGEDFWGDNWAPLYSVLGGNPLAAMPSLHFATSVMAAQLLAETGPVAGALGWAYASTLGLALVYLGEHYAIDLIAGAALTTTVRRLGPHAGPALASCGRAIAALEAKAHEAG